MKALVETFWAFVRALPKPLALLLVMVPGIGLGALTEYEVDQRGGPAVVAERVGQSVGLDMPADHNLDHLAWSHWKTRDFVLQLQAAQTPAGSTLLLGDSIIEGFRWNHVKANDHRCVVLNAGYAGIGVADLHQHMVNVLAQQKPRFVFLSVGFNDAWPDANATAWAAEYDSLVDDILKTRATLIISTILPPEPGFNRSTKSRETIVKFNQAIRSIARRHNLILADIASPGNRWVSLPSPHRSIDGVHPTGQFYSLLRDFWIGPALSAAERMRRESCVDDT